MTIYENELVKIKLESHKNPWLIIFTQRKVKEFSQTTTEEKNEIFKYLDIIEREMLDFFQPEKINIASFGNMLPHLHWHIQARFIDDEYFPNPLWGEKMRENIALHVEPIENFLKILKTKL